MMDVKSLHDEQDYDWALGEASKYFDEQPGRNTPEGDRFEVLLTLIRAYEEENYALPHADPVDVLHFAIESMGHSQAELSNLIGRNRSSEILNRVRPLTLDMIRKINQAWGIPVEALTPEYELI